MSNLINLAEKAIKTHNMLVAEDNVIVALSGGADSVALLHTLLSLKDLFKLNIMAAHINHNLRGEEADRDESFVRKLCKDNNVKLFVKSIDINKIAKDQKISTELCGRNERYNYFKELSVKYSAKIATAHTASDNAETVLFNLTRGSGLKGMTGIQPVRDYIIRPLICCTRQDIEEYCKENNLQFVTDSSNLTDDYTRNKIRHNVIPSLKEINSDIDNTILRTSCLFDDINDYISQQVEISISQAKTDYGYNAEFLSELHPALKNSVIHRICKDENIEVESSHIQLIANCLKNGGAVDLQGDKRAVVKQGLFRIISVKNNEANNFRINFKNDISFEFNEKLYKVSTEESKNNKELLNPELAEKNLYFRTRQSGDVFTLPHRNVTKTLKKLFNELKIPAELRDNLLVLTDGSVIYWIESIGASKQGICSDICGLKITVNT